MTRASRTSPLRSWLRLVRAGALFSPAADVVAGAAVAATPWSLELVRAATASVLVYAAGMVLNDHADRAEDAVHRPERPIPSGAIPARSAALGGVGLLALGVAIAPWRLGWAVIALGVVFYDYVAKRTIALAAPTMGLLRAANLTVGASFATGALVFDGPVAALALAYAAYITSVTVLGALEDEPKVAPRAVIAIQAIPPLVALLGLSTLPDRGPALAIGAVLALAFVTRVRRHGNTWDQAAIRRSMMWLLLGTMVFTALIALGSGRPWDAGGIALAIVPARWIARRISLT